MSSTRALQCTWNGRAAPHPQFYQHHGKSVFAFERYIQQRLRSWKPAWRADYRSMSVAKFNDRDQIIRPTFDWFNLSGPSGASSACRHPGKPRFQVASLPSLPLRPTNCSVKRAPPCHRGPGIGNDSLDVAQPQNHPHHPAPAPGVGRPACPAYLNPMNGFIYLRPTGDYELTIRGEPSRSFAISRPMPSSRGGLDLDVSTSLTPGWTIRVWAAPPVVGRPSAGQPLVRYASLQFRHSLRCTTNRRTRQGRALSAGSRSGRSCGRTRVPGGLLPLLHQVMSLSA